MTTQVARPAARASRPAVSAGVPILAAKITAPGRAGLGGAAAADHQADRPGQAVVPADGHHRPGGRGQDDGSPSLADAFQLAAPGRGQAVRRARQLELI
jgi:hypothetical protein